MLLNFANTLQAQSQNWWKVDGNTNGSSTSFLGTTNNQPLQFKTNNTTRIQLPTNGGVIFNHLIGTGSGLVKYDNNGNLIPFAFTTDSTKVLYADGTWRNINFTNSGWTTSSNNLYNTTKNIGIGTSSPQYTLDVNGNARVTGTLYAGNIMITDKVQTDTANIGVITLPSYNTIIGDPHITGNTQVTGNGTYTGNVGIGVTNPTVKLDVNGSIKTNGNITANSLTVNGVTSFTNKVEAYRIAPLPGDSEIRFGDSTIILNTYYNRITFSSSLSGNLGLGIGTMTQSQAPRGIAIGNNLNVYKPFSVVIGKGYGNSANQSFNNDVENSLMVSFNSDLPTFFVGPANGQGTLGNVGVGTKSPTERFQVNGGNILVKGTDNFSANGNTATLFLGDNNNYIKSTFGGAVSIGVFQYPDLVVVNQNGSVGIGTVNIPDPNYKLSVNGSIRAKRVVVETGWSDFVFKPDYKLMSFEELENYILQNGHLPNIPSEKEIVDNGADVGEILKLHMQKIEELTLYILQLQKEIEILKKK